MTTTGVESETYFRFNHTFYNEQINKVIDVVVPQFESVVRRHVLFHAFFLILGLTEVFLFLYFFNAIAGSSMIAMTLGAIFLTLFSYFILKLYAQTQKEEQLAQIKQRFLRGCQELIQYQSGVPEHHIALANACSKWANRLEGGELQHFQPPGWLGFLSPMMQRFSWYCLWQDYHVMRELLLTNAVAEHIELVKIEPTDLEVHASLANAYVMLSSLYTPKKRGQAVDDARWVPADTMKQMNEKFRVTAERAIEEFKILSAYAPDDPWVHTQLAYSYHDLQMPEEEIHEYEIISKLNPHDLDSLYKLGTLYFKQGLNAKGLRIYELLSQHSYDRAESLIRSYGANISG